MALGENTGKTGVLLWWNNHADVPLNDWAWVCSEHAENLPDGEALMELSKPSSLVVSDWYGLCVPGKGNPDLLTVAKQDD